MFLMRNGTRLHVRVGFGYGVAMRVMNVTDGCDRGASGGVWSFRRLENLRRVSDIAA